MRTLTTALFLSTDAQTGAGGFTTSTHPEGRPRDKPITARDMFFVLHAYWGSYFAQPLKFTNASFATSDKTKRRRHPEEHSGDLPRPWPVPGKRILSPRQVSFAKIPPLFGIVLEQRHQEQQLGEHGGQRKKLRDNLTVGTPRVQGVLKASSRRMG